MSWFTTTRWIDTEVENIDSALELIMEDNEYFENEVGITYANLEKNKIFDEVQKISINNKDITYNLIEFTIDSITPGDGSAETRTSRINGLILVYELGGSIKYIINRNHDAQKLLRKFCHYDKKNEIIEDNPIFSSDIFMWFVKRVFTDENSFSFTQPNQTEKELTINTILGVRGETRDENKLSAQGNTVMNLVSTLSFILESNKLKQLIIRIEYSNHENIEIKLTNKGVVSNEIHSYSGEYDDSDSYELKAKLLLLVYLEIIPNFLQVYHNNIASNEWNSEEKENFFELIENQLIDRLEKRKSDIIEQKN